MNFSKRFGAQSRFPAPRRGTQAQRSTNGGAGGDAQATPACRGKPCCIKPTDDSCFRVAACDDMPIPVAIDGTVDVSGTVEVSLGSEPLCVGVEMCGSEPLCVQMENKPDTTLCMTSFSYTPISSVKQDASCAYTSQSFADPANEGEILLPFYYATNVPVLCAPSDQIVRLKGLQQRFNSGPIDDLSPGLSGWKVASSNQTFLQSASFAEMALNYSQQSSMAGVPCDIACEGLAEAPTTFLFEEGGAFSSGIGIDLAPNDVLLGTMEVFNPNDQTANEEVYCYYLNKENPNFPNFQAGDFKAFACCQARPSCVEPLSGVQDTFVTDLQVFALDEQPGQPTVAVSFCIVDCENEPITVIRNFDVELDAQQGVNPPFTASMTATKVIGEPNKYEALFTLGLIPLITVNQLRVRDVPSNDIVFQSTQQFLLGAAA